MESQNNFNMEPHWFTVLKEEFEQPYFSELTNFLKNERASGMEIYPPKGLVFNAFWKTPIHKVKVVIVGQDPYHGPGQAQGLCFSVPRGIPLPPSLQNIFKELHADLGIAKPSQGCLEEWADQGVLLLNNTLTVKKGEPLSHHGRGWERFTDAVLKKLQSLNQSIIFVLWGKAAQIKCQFLISEDHKHKILKAAHPSPFSAYQGFFGCGHFSKINEILKSQGQTPIDWKISD